MITGYPNYRQHKSGAIKMGFSKKMLRSLKFFFMFRASTAVCLCNLLIEKTWDA